MRPIITNPYGAFNAIPGMTEPLEAKIPDDLNPVEELKLRALCRIADNITRIWLDQEKAS